MRSVDPLLKPKYLLISEEPERAVFLSKTETLLPSAAPSGTLHAFDIVITEDILSAIRVGCHCKAGALLGTAVSPEKLSEILRDTGYATEQLQWYEYEAPSIRCAIWLDPDKAGAKSNRRLAHNLRMQGLQVTEIRTDKDPKYYSDTEIRSILLEHRAE